MALVVQKYGGSSVADAESIEAKWVTLDELQSLRMRGSEPHEWFSYLEAGGQIYPLAGK